MKVSCPSCQQILNVPDDKIPKDQKIKVPCPKCHAQITISGTPEAPKSLGAGDPALAALEELGPPEDLVEAGVETSLVCLSNAAHIERVENALRQLDYFVSIAQNAKHALQKLHNNIYNVVVLEENFDGSKLASNPILRYMLPMQMQNRRHVFLCLLSETLRTMDQLAGFRLGVNMVLNVRDLDKTKGLLERAIRDHHRFYRVYFDELERMGQL